MSLPEESRAGQRRLDEHRRDQDRVDQHRVDQDRVDQDRLEQHRADRARAAEALDRLVRNGDTERWSWPLIAGVGDLPRWKVVGAISVAVALVAVLVISQRRPPAVDDRLPMADASATTASAGADADAAAAASSVSTVAPGDPSSTQIAAEGRIVVHVAGAVSTPGVVDLPASSRVVDAVHAAGGLTADADPDRVNLAAPLGDGQRVLIPLIGQPVPTEIAPSAPPSGTASADGTSEDGGAGALVDLNAADASQLDELPGVGPSTAAAIIAHREKEGPFTSVDGLIDVRGIGEAKLEALRDLVTVGG